MASERQRGNDLGPTGWTVAENVKTFRGRLPLRELSERLASVGHPISVSSLQKIEHGRRRVEVDDLVALAFVLGVNPNALLAPVTRAHDASFETTGLGDMGAAEFWAWLDGELPFQPAGESDAGALATPDENEWRAFTERTRPPFRRTVPHQAVSDAVDSGDLVTAVDMLRRLIEERLPADGDD